MSSSVQYGKLAGCDSGRSSFHIIYYSGWQEHQSNRIKFDDYCTSARSELPDNGTSNNWSNITIRLLSLYLSGLKFYFKLWGFRVALKDWTETSRAEASKKRLRFKAQTKVLIALLCGTSFLDFFNIVRSTYTIRQLLSPLLWGSPDRADVL